LTFFSEVLTIPKVDLSKPTLPIFDFQHERISMAAGAASAYIDSPEIKLKRHQENIIGLLITAPCNGHCGFKYSDGDYIINRTHKLLYENSDGDNTNEGRFYPIHLPKAQGRVYKLDFAPSVTQDNPYYIDLVFLTADKFQSSLKGYKDSKTLYRRDEVPSFKLYEFALLSRPDNLDEEQLEACKLVIDSYRNYAPISPRYINIVTYLLNRTFPEWEKLHGLDPDRIIPTYEDYKAAQAVYDNFSDDNIIQISLHIIEAYEDYNTVPSYFIDKLKKFFNENF